MNAENKSSTEDDDVSEVDQTNDGCQVYTPTIADRLWKRLGFRYRLVDLPEGIEETMPGWMMTKVVFGFSFWDRVRLLISGRMLVEIRQATSAKVDECISAASFKIEPPWSK